MIVYSRITTAPDYLQVVSLVEAKAHLEVTGTGKDSQITTLIKVAGRLCEIYSGLSFTTQVRTVTLDGFPSESIVVPHGPVVSVGSLAYTDDNGDPQTLTITTDYLVDLNSNLLRISAVDAWPSTDSINNAVTITYTAGMLVTNPDLQIAKQAMLMQIATFFENRQDEIVGSITSELNWNSRALLDTIKVYWNANAD